jgi:hypothetical protein
MVWSFGVVVAPTSQQPARTEPAIPPRTAGPACNTVAFLRLLLRHQGGNGAAGAGRRATCRAAGSTVAFLRLLQRHQGGYGAASSGPTKINQLAPPGLKGISPCSPR